MLFNSYLLTLPLILALRGMVVSVSCSSDKMRDCEVAMDVNILKVLLKWRNIAWANFGRISTSVRNVLVCTQLNPMSKQVLQSSKKDFAREKYSVRQLKYTIKQSLKNCKTTHTDAECELQLLKLENKKQMQSYKML